jgi:hypothetical protein
VITGAALCPAPPLLARELTGQALALPELRDACQTAVARLLAGRPDVVAVVGGVAGGDGTGRWDPRGALEPAVYAPALRLAGRLAGVAALPLILGIGARLLDEAGYRGPRLLQGVAASASPKDCQLIGADLAAAADRVALLAMGEGSARRSVSAPGYLDERAAPYDEAVERAVRDGDLAALADLDPGLSAELMATGRPAWQALVGAVSLGTRPDALRAEILYFDAPLGVGYLVASLS